MSSKPNANETVKLGAEFSIFPINPYVIMPPFPSFLAPLPLGLQLLNRLLSQHEWARERLQRHSGKSVALGFSKSTRIALLTIGYDGQLQLSDCSIVPDVQLILPADALFKLPETYQQEGFDGIVGLLTIQGDAGLAKLVAELAANLSFDFEDELAHIVGDVAAVRLLGFAQKLRGAARRVASRSGANLSEYLVYEQNQLLGRPAFADWRNNLALANRRLQALEQAVSKLEQGSPPSSQGVLC